MTAVDFKGVRMIRPKSIAAATMIGSALGLAALGAGAGVANAAPTSPGIPFQQDWWGHGGHWGHGGWGGPGWGGPGWGGPGPGWGGGPGYGYGGAGYGYGGPAGGCVSGPLGFVSVCI